MKKYIKRFTRYNLIFVSLFLTLAACEKDDPDMPGTKKDSSKVNVQVTHSITQLKELYDGSDLFDINEEINIQGTVISSDSTGNIFKSIYLIDDSGQGIQVKVNKTDLYLDYKIGQRLYIKCKGLMLGQYGGIIQIGGEYKGKIGSIDEALIADHIIKGALESVPTPTKLDLKALPKDIEKLYNTWVTLENVQFVEQNVNYTDGQKTTNRVITIASGEKVVVRTSNMASFAGEQLPSKSGSITAILSAYNGDLQLTLNSLNDIKFNAPRFNISAGIGKGTLAEPFDIKAAVAREGEKEVWIKGYIIGSVNGKSFKDDFVLGSQTSSSVSNVLIDTNKEVKDAATAFPIQLSDLQLRSDLNLKDNKVNYKKEIWIKGDLEKYYSTTGLKNVTAYSFDGKTVVTIQGSSNAIGLGSEIKASEFTKSVIDFITWNETASGAVWASNNKKVSVNAYKKGATTAWMISKNEVDFSLLKTPRLIITEELKYFSDFKDIEVLASTDYKGGDPTKANWSVLKADGTRKNSGINEVQFNVSGSAHIAFRYKASDTKSMEWIIKNVEAAEKGAVQPADPVKGDGLTIATAFNVAGVKANQGAAKNKDYKWAKGKIVGYLTSTGFKPGAAGAGNTNIVIALRDNETNESKIVSVQLSKGYIRDGLNLVDNPSYVNKEVWIKGAFEKYYGLEGIKSIKAFSIDGSTEVQDPGNISNPILGQGTDILGSSLVATSIDFSTWNETSSEMIWTAKSGKASINGRGKGKNTSWLISKSKVDFSSFTSPRLMVNEQISSFKALSNVRIVYSTNYSGSGNPTAATWTDLTVDGTRLTSGSTTTLLELPNGVNNIYIAFVYTNNDDSDASSWSISSVKADDKPTGPILPAGVNLGDTNVSGFSDLIISEYVEGSSNNKYIEIFNGTGNDVDLSNYSISKDGNGNDDFTKTVTPLSGTLPNGATFLICNSRASLTLPSGVTTKSIYAVNFNGDDQVALQKNSTIIDQIGIPGDVDYAKDKTFRRKSNVRVPKAGSNDPRVSTNPATEWDVFSKDDVSGLGTHSYK
ncbi:DUF5689 domain-containing protein [Flammeovirga kamogawensis]|uniref:Lamin tail domain-containing protein n=1 Tax=Flammeovirga kamogawensis TaxID=373891 RepID=A0ABX8H3R6_9BACT|nr:DUF5689 domain-containing protein [Flammeovirga kamogawensis]MBB6460396.1 hypothetical protein [Flammeovirga kamogawensis]QWG10202.1 lamin tail domain-containing protein [Flammeovirga kamogawensis]TRX64654.1 hypothetical protein EO216_19130 [Flammeovirga kamogawensis]